MTQLADDRHLRTNGCLSDEMPFELWRGADAMMSRQIVRAIVCFCCAMEPQAERCLCAHKSDLSRPRCTHRAASWVLPSRPIVRAEGGLGADRTLLRKRAPQRATACAQTSTASEPERCYEKQAARQSSGQCTDTDNIFSRRKVDTSLRQKPTNHSRVSSTGRAIFSLRLRTDLRHGRGSG